MHIIFSSVLPATACIFLYSVDVDVSSSVFQKFLFYVLKSSDVLDILVPILFYLNDARANQCECPVLPFYCTLRDTLLNNMMN